MRLQWNRRQKANTAIADVLNFSVDRRRSVSGYLQVRKFLHLEISTIGKSLVLPALFVSCCFHEDMLIRS